MGEPSQRDAVGSHAAGRSDDRTLIGAGDTATPAGRLGGGHEWIGRRLGRYRLTGLLGGGGMGVVYRARDEVIEREVALKVLPPELSGDPTALARFLSEAKAAGRLSHSNAVALYEIGEEGGIGFLVMELVAGGSLADEVRRIGPLSPVAATRAIAEAARGVAAAHTAGIVHRDIKPANLLRSNDGAVKVCDFGLAKETLGDRGGVTQAGHVVGTPYYMSPEQCEGRPVDARSDVYALGAAYYFLLTGAEPYADAGSTMQVMFAHCHGEPLDPRFVNALVPEECAAVVRKAAAKSPADRYASAGEMLRDLEALLSGLSGARSGQQVRLGLSAANSAAGRSAPAAAATQVTAAPVRRMRPGWLVATGGVAFLTAAAALLLTAFTQREDPPVEPAADVTAPGSEIAPADSAPTAPGVAAPTGGPIKVGILHSLSGLMANSESPVVDAELLAIDEVNRAGGVLNRPLEAVVADGRSDPEVFLREAERLIDREKVAVVFGCWTSAARKTIVPLFEDRDHLLVYPVQHEGLAESPNVLYTGGAPNQLILPAIEWAVRSLGAKRFFIVGSDYVFPRAAAAIIKDAAPGLSIEIVGEEYLPLGSRSAGAAASLIAAQKPDVVLNLINGDTNVTFFAALRRAEVLPQDVPTISFSVGKDELWRVNISDIAGDYAAWNYFEVIESPENEAFLAAFRARYGPQRFVTDPMQSGYVGVKLWAAAANEAGSVDPRPVRKALRSQRLSAPEGPVRVDPDSQHLFKTPRVGQMGEDGRFQIVWSAPAPVAPIVYPPTRSAEQWKAFLRDLQRSWGGRWTAPND